MAFRRGIFISEEPTPIVPPVRVNTAMPVAFVTAPVHLAEDPYAVTNKPELLHTYADAVRKFGFSLRPGIWDNYTAPQMIFSQFALYAVAPLVLVNVLDPTIHNEVVTDENLTLGGYRGILEVDSVLIDTVSIQGYEEGTHYTLSFNRDGFVVVNAFDDITGGIVANATLTIGFTKLAPEKVDIYDVIGGYDMVNDKNFGLEIVEDIFPDFRLVPGQLLAPGFSSDPVVAAVMETKGGNINGHFRCITLCDMPTLIENNAGEMVRHRYTNVPAWKNRNNFTSTRQINLYPMLRLGNQIYYYSTQMAGRIGRTDFENRMVPYRSPSNQRLEINGICDANGDEIKLNINQANFLAGQGITSAVNWTQGWVSWGGRTGAFPGTTDPKDVQISIRRMFDWVGNTIVLTHWSRIDQPITPRRVKTIIDSVGIWFNSLTAQEFILGGRIELLPTDNPKTDLLDGFVRFRIHIAPPPPMEAAEFIQQYDPSYLQTLFQ